MTNEFGSVGQSGLKPIPDHIKSHQFTVSNLDNAALPKSSFNKEGLEPGQPVSNLETFNGNAQKLSEKAKNTPLEKVGNTLLRVLAGAAGGPLYAAALAVGGLFTVALGGPALLIALPFGMMAAGIVKTKYAGKAFFFIVGGAEAVTEFPRRAIIFNTLGKLGAGLCAFASTGKTHKEQLAKRHEMKAEEKTIEESTYKKLLGPLARVTIPMLAHDSLLFTDAKKNKKS